MAGSGVYRMAGRKKLERQAKSNRMASGSMRKSSSKKMKKKY